MEKTLKVGNDIGNSQQKIIIGGEEISQPSCFSKVHNMPNLDFVNEESIRENVYDHIFVSIDSKVCGTYYCGNKSLTSGLNTYNIDITEKKCDSAVYFVNTIGALASHMVLHDMESVNVDMVCSLPVNQYNLEDARKLRELFMGEHYATFHINTNTRIRVLICFDFVHVLPESVSTIFTHCEFMNKTILHIAIGEGTTEYPVTNGLNFNPELIFGSNNGVGHAIENSLSEFCERLNMRTFSRQKFSKLIMNEDHKFYPVAIEILNQYLETEATDIYRHAKKEIERIAEEIDMLFVHGGGSILLQDLLKVKLQKICDDKFIDLYYAKPEDAVTYEAKGLYEFSTGEIFKNLKEQYWGSKNEKP